MASIVHAKRHKVIQIEKKPKLYMIMGSKLAMTTQNRTFSYMDFPDSTLKLCPGANRKANLLRKVLRTTQKLWYSSQELNSMGSSGLCTQKNEVFQLETGPKERCGIVGETEHLYKERLNGLGLFSPGR